MAEQINSLIRTMTPADVAAGMRLKEIAGWNQTQEDWERFLRASPEGCFVAEWNGQVVGTVTTIVYEGRFAWIGMVLVDPQMRGKGIGTALLEKAIDHLDSMRVPCVKLDATPQGKPLYSRLGFQTEYEIERHRLARDSMRLSSAETSGAYTENNGCATDGLDKDPKAFLKMDREVFGADRGDLLQSVAGSAPDLVMIARRKDEVQGYALGRRGSLADHLGPWVATNAQAAREVFEGFLRRAQREVVFVDVVRDNPWAPGLLAASGFKFSRTLTRMYRGENTHPGRPNFLCAILGPEFG